MVIGPQIDLSGSLSQISEHRARTASNILVEQKEQNFCGLPNCIGTNIAISAGLQVATDIIQFTNGTILKSTADENLFQPKPHFPVPRPRLDRAS
jgi:hypothetical protein